MKNIIAVERTNSHRQVLVISVSVMLLCAVLAPSLKAADLHQAKPGEIVIMREVTPQPHNRVDQEGPIISKVDLKPEPIATEYLVDPVNRSIKAIALTDEQAAGVRGSTPAGGMVVEALAGDQSPVGKQGGHALTHGQGLNRNSNMNSGRLTQVLGGGGGGAQGGGATNNAMQGFSGALGQAFGKMHK